MISGEASCNCFEVNWLARGNFWNAKWIFMEYQEVIHLYRETV